MNSFSLSKKIEKTFPETLTVDGRVFAINPGFRVHLKIIRLLEDDSVFDLHKIGLIARWFFVDEYPPDVLGALNMFFSQSHSRSANRSTEECTRDVDSGVDFCYEFDADVIYTSFLQAYQIDLLRVPFLHWYDFQLRLVGLPSDSPFRLRLKLRGLDLSHYKGQELMEMSAAKDAVQLPEKLTYEEQQDVTEFEDMWGNVGH